MTSLLFTSTTIAAPIKITNNADANFGTVIKKQATGNCILDNNGVSGSACEAVPSNITSAGQVTIFGDINKTVTLIGYQHNGQGFTATPVFYRSGTSTEVRDFIVIDQVNTTGNGKGKGMIELDVGFIIQITNASLLPTSTTITLDVESDYL